MLLWPRNTSTAPSHGLLSKGSPCLCTSFSGQSHHWSIISHHIDLTSKTDFTRLCCSSIAGRDHTYLKMKSPALLNLSRIVMSTQSDEGVWRLYTWSRVLNTYCIEKTLRLRIFWPCPLTLSTEVKSKLNFKIARKYFVRSEHFLQLLIDFAWVRGSSCVNDWLWFNSRQLWITEWIIQVGVV